jgi:hypothetical protein
MQCANKFHNQVKVEEASEDGKESPHSAHANGMNVGMNQ